MGMSQIEAVEEDATSLVVDGITLQGEWLTHASDTSELTAATTTIDTVAYAVGHQPIIDNGFKYKIKFEDNSGDLPDLTCNTNDLRSVYRLKQAAYVSRDEPDRVWFVDTKQGSAQPSYYAAAHADMTHPSAVTAGDTIYVGEQRCDVVSSDADSTAGLKGEGSADATACATVLEYNGQNRLVRWANGDTIADVSTHELMDNNDIAVNDRVSIRTMNSHTYETRTVDYINLQGLGVSTDNFFTVSQPFTAAHAEKRIFLNFKGTTSSAACSGRGLCDGSSAECQCFKGYTGQACQIQNALAA